MRDTIRIGLHTAEIFLPDGAEIHPVIYLHDGEGAEKIWPLLTKPMTLVCISGIDWNRDLSPWPAKKVFEEDFAGRADTYLSEMAGSIIPAVERHLGFTPARRGIAGYSLAGLFAVYAIYKTDIFSVAASVSGSLWFDGFVGYLKSHTPPAIPERVYFSLGDREKLTKNSRMACVEDQTAEAERVLRHLGAQTVFERNPGNHFVHVPSRIARGLDWVGEKR
jgi:Predicted hydrolase of the alpha/beta superfamily